MLALIRYGVEKSHAFKIMEMVRKGKGLTPEYEAEMRAANVPDWYIASCKKIKYMFPKAHAAAYDMSASRLGWYKVHRPLAFYCAMFTVQPNGFDGELVMRGKRAVQSTSSISTSAAMRHSPRNSRVCRFFSLSTRRWRGESGSCRWTSRIPVTASTCRRAAASGCPFRRLPGWRQRSRKHRCCPRRGAVFLRGGSADPCQADKGGGGYSPPVPGAGRIG